MNTYNLEKEAEACWRHYLETNGLPPYIPENPDEVYADEWQGWVKFLGWMNIEMNQMNKEIVFLKNLEVT